MIRRIVRLECSMGRTDQLQQPVGVAHDFLEEAPTRFGITPVYVRLAFQA